jgi:hypothetical protein
MSEKNNDQEVDIISIYSVVNKKINSFLYLIINLFISFFNFFIILLILIKKIIFCCHRL